MGTKTRSAGRVHACYFGPKGGPLVDIIFKGRRTDVQERFREHASAKLGKIEKLDRRASESTWSFHRSATRASPTSGNASS